MIILLTKKTFQKMFFLVKKYKNRRKRNEQEIYSKFIKYKSWRNKDETVYKKYKLVKKIKIKL